MGIRTHADWLDFSAKLSVRHSAFINGQFVPSVSGETFDTINPATGKPIAAVASCDATDVDLAVAAARAVFERGSWSRMTPADRKRRLIRFCDLMEVHADELACLESIDAGKPIADCVAVDLPLSIECARWYGEAIDKLCDEVAPIEPDIIAFLRREPLGVIGAIVPWAFPLLTAMRKIGPILAAGNSLVLKPAEQSPLTALRVAELASEADIPDGVLNVLPGLGDTAGRALGLHMDVDAIDFTGSSEVGRCFMSYAGQSNLKRVSADCGGKSPNIVLSDAADLDAAASAVAWGIFCDRGEISNASSRLIVQASIKDAFLDKVMDVAGSMRVGDPLDPATDIGPLIDEKLMKRILGHIKKARKEGASLDMGGSVVKDRAGFYVEPTLFSNVGKDMAIAREEILGPVLSAITVRDFDEATQIANESINGPAATVWTSNLETAFRASSRLRAGVVRVNCRGRGDRTNAPASAKQSGAGHERSLRALDKYSDLKTRWIALQN